mmetsp:Transcript_2114/g.4090  ORF Transcript_2114/g.4090 Transcript_2114/m.4090 type:complete len:406 (-) Transcript_2114:770-1987(-)|eukprot:CAMPEP_0202694374 /NCGR_PEP_ID=MMETSP1385-20130828/8245_1 /ASSEMBLY_ACC=CAM_ASM_000861 /TAXON_ID=933848 /ORGANISM="Elphidium margaritaceum" /LENGTH=405 /DNA_ID=CAMNT_0049350205 /DNA_START=38 /DNA_END=1255 /DNA_ORIENTATION=-
MAAKKTFHDPTQQAEGRAARWKNEPLSERHPSLRVHTKRPFNAEPSNFALQAMYTPKGQHYRRTHAPVPLVDEDLYRLSVCVESKLAKQFSMQDLKSKVAKEIAVTLMCTGNRRGEYNQYGSTAGLPWKNGSISTAKWKGCSLRKVLNDAGIFYEQAKRNGYRFVTFWGLEDYHISIPLKKAMDEDGDCLLCYGMNNEAIPRDHGAPLRCIIPGFVGARSVKWLDKIVLSASEVVGLHQTGIAYKQLGPNYKDLGKIPKSVIAELPPIDIIPVTSAVTAPDDESTLIRGQMFEVKGYAYSGGGRAISRVDVSIDNGKTWDQARLTRAVNGDDQVQNIRTYKAWAWCQWRYTVKIPHGVNEVCICCKAVDDQYNQQPHEVEPIWNVRGVLNTSWGRVVVKTNGARL